MAKILVLDDVLDAVTLIKKILQKKRPRSIYLYRRGRCLGLCKIQ